MNESSENGRIPVAVIGAGRMGRHHVRIASRLPQAKLVAVVDADEERAATLADEHGGEPLTDVAALLEQFPEVKAVSIATPTQYHKAVAEQLLPRGVACLIEKPLAPSVAEARALVDLADEHKTLLQVGHTERFNPAIRAVANLKMPARFIEVDRVSPMTFRSLDVGVVMDMMIHDLDIVLMLADSPIAKVDAAGVAVLGQHEDIASARITFQSGCVANLTASRIAMKTDRKMRLFSEEGYVSLDYQQRSGVIIGRNPANTSAIEDMRQHIAAGKDLSDLDYTELIDVQQLSMEENPDGQDPLTAEISSFLDAVISGQTSNNSTSGEAGYAAVAAAEQVVASIKAHHWEGVDTKSDQPLNLLAQ